MINSQWRYLFFLTIFFLGCKPLDISTYEEPREHINSNNEIYKDGVQIRFDYFFIQNEDTLKCDILMDDFMPTSPWYLVKLQDTSGLPGLIDKIDLEVTGGLFFDQTEIKFDLLSPDLKPYPYLWSKTGLIENEHQVWTHPVRIFQFHLTEFNPFPEIRYPLKKGKKWTSTISPYPNPVYNRWIKFDERMDCVATYKITDKIALKTKLGVLDCYVTEATAINPHSEGHLTSYFNEKYGFVKLDYTNIDGSRLVMEVIDFKISKALSSDFLE